MDAGQVRELGREEPRIAAHETVVRLGGHIEAHRREPSTSSGSIATSSHPLRPACLGGRPVSLDSADAPIRPPTPRDPGRGRIRPHSAKTAYGVIRYGRDDVIAVLDSTQAGRNVSDYLPGHDIPIVASLDEALAPPSPPDALLIGIAPTGGKLPRAWRATILPRSTPASTSVRAPHVPRRRPRVRGAAARGRDRDRRLPPPAGADGDRGRAPPRPGQAGDPDRRHRLRDRQDVGRARAASRGRSRAGRSARLRADRPDRDDDRGLGRRRSTG